MKKIPLSSYIAWNNPAGAKSAIESFGYQVLNVRNQSDLAECVRQFMNEKGEQALVALAKVHPDRDLILDNQKPESATFLGAHGFSEAEVVTKTETATVQPATTIQKTQTDYTPMIIAGMFFSAMLLTAAIIIKK